MHWHNNYLLALVMAWNTAMPADACRHRIIVLTDIENEPDDAQSLIRFLLYSNQWDTEGATPGPKGKSGRS
jgi:hypothetical protein